MALVGLVVVLGAAGFVVFGTEAFLSELEVGPLGSAEEVEPMLDETAAFHGDPKRWAAQPMIELRARGAVPFTPARLAFGLADENVELTMRFDPGGYGVATYELIDGEAVRRSDVPKLLLDSVRHLFELPFTARSIPYRAGLPAGADGRRRAFFTWGRDATPTSKWDQIVLWSDGGHVQRMDTTGRDIAPFIIARVELEGLVRLGDFRIPKRAVVLDDGRDGAVVHAWEIISIDYSDGTSALALE